MKHCINKRCKNEGEWPGVQCPECRAMKYQPKPKESLHDTNPDTAIPLTLLAYAMAKRKKGMMEGGDFSPRKNNLLIEDTVAEQQAIQVEHKDTNPSDDLSKMMAELS